MNNNKNEDYRKLIQQSLVSIRNLKEQVAKAKQADNEPIAIIGMGCHFPGNCNTPEQFWEFLKSGKDGITNIPSDRWNVEEYYSPVRGQTGKMYIKQGYFLKTDVSEFDAKYFKIAPVEANGMDPQQRQLLEVCVETLENAGQNIAELRGSKTGVFIGISSNSEYSKITQDEAKFNPYMATGTNSCIASGRICYEFGFNGPAVSFDTACSSSMVSTYMAMKSLRSGEIDLALSGGVNLMLSPLVINALCVMNALSEDGRCKPFDANGDGYGRGEGCGMIALKRLSDAQRDHDTIYAVLKGGAMNNDGESSGLTVPNGAAQERVLQDALDSCGVSPDDVTYIESHGTGTALGDPLEMGAIKNVYFKKGARTKDRPLYIGAVKGNIGHLESAAGIAGIIKTALCIYHGEIPPLVNMNEINPRLGIGNLPIEFPKETFAWKEKDESRQRTAAISSFGFSGTNVNLILSEAPKRAECKKTKEVSGYILKLSAKEEKVLVNIIKNMNRYLDANPDINIADICYTSNVCRANEGNRVVAVGKNREEIKDGLKAILNLYMRTGTLYNDSVTLLGSSEGLDRMNAKRTMINCVNDNVFSAQVDGMIKPKVAFVFNEELEQFVYGLKDLIKQFPIFNNHFKDCIERFVQNGFDVRYDNMIENRFNNIQEKQLCLFAAEYAFGKLLEELGVIPEVVFGERSGAYAAAAIAGYITLDAAVKYYANYLLVERESKDILNIRVMANREQIDALMEKEDSAKICVAASLACTEKILSVHCSIYDKVTKKLKDNQIEFKEEIQNWPSKLKQDIVNKYVFKPEKKDFAKPKYRYISAVNVQALRKSDAVALELSGAHMTETEKYDDAMKFIYEQGYRNYAMICNTPGERVLETDLFHDDGVIVHVMLRQDSIEQSLMQFLGKIYCFGGVINWNQLYDGYEYEKVVLPNYPFNKSSYWLALPQEEDRLILYNAHNGLKGKEINLPMEQKQYMFVLTYQNLPELADNSGVLHIGYYLEMLESTFDKLFDGDEHVIESMKLMSPIMIFEDEKKEVLLTLENESETDVIYKFFSKNYEENKWNIHVSGRIHRGKREKTVNANLTELRDRCSRPDAERDEFYDVMVKDHGFYFGPSVRWVNRLQKDAGGKEALISFRKRTDMEKNKRFFLGYHPGIMDCSAQCANFIKFQLSESGKKYMVSELYEVKADICYNDDELYGHLTFLDFDEDKGEILVSIDILNEMGEQIVRIGKMKLKEFDEEKLLTLREGIENGDSGDGKDKNFLMRYLQATSEERLDMLTEYIRQVMANALEMDPEDLDPYSSLDDVGLDSMAGLRFMSDLVKRLGIDLVFSDFYNCNNIHDSAYMIRNVISGENLTLDSLKAEMKDYKEDLSVDRWIFNHNESDKTKVRIFCFPNGYNSADMFEGWKEILGDEVDVCGIQIPGMDNCRLDEKAPEDIDEFAAVLEEVLIKNNLLDKPCAVFGHSWGSLFAYRVAYRLSQNKDAKVIRLFVSGFTSPIQKNTMLVRILDELNKSGIDSLPDYEELKENSFSYDAVVQAFGRAWNYEEDLTKMTLHLLLTAVRLIDRYVYNPEELFNVPIVGFHGIDDYLVDIQEMLDWEPVTKSSFQLYTMAGDHQFVNRNQSENILLEDITTELKKAIDTL